MKENDEVKVIESPYEVFGAGTQHTIYSVVGDLVYLLDPLYQGTNQEDAIWPFLEDELELVVI